MLDDLYQDLRFALRTLSRRPAFTAGVVAILALGIGANTAIFSVAHGVLLRPLPYPESARLVELWPADTTNKRAALAVEGMATLEASSAYSSWRLPLLGDGTPEVLSVGKVGTRHFEVLGATPALGRTFAAEEREPGQAGVAVLSHALWQRRFGGDESVLGATLDLDGVPHRVIGVMPASHRPLEADWQLWTPLVFDHADENDLDGSFYLDVVARLAAGATVEQADAELRTVATALRDQRPQRFTSDRIETARAVSLHEHLVGRVRPTLLVLLGAVGFILLIACANVANLLLVRAAGRARELALRAALGAGTGRMLSMMMVESLVLALAGGALGVVVAAWSFDLLRAALPAGLPRVDELRFDAPVLAFAVAASLLAAALIGAVPALRAGRGVRAGLPAGIGGGALGRRASAGPASSRLSGALVAGQVAAAVVLLVGAGLLIESVARLRAVDPGFRAEQVLALRLVPPEARYAEHDATVALYDRLLERVRATPGVAAAGAIHLLPLGFGNWNFPYRYEGQELPADQAAGTPLPVANFRVLTPGYFETMGVPLLRGRRLADSDRAGAEPVGLINRTLAETLWPGEDPIGKRIFVFGSDDNVFSVAGVVGDVRQQRLREAALPELYLPLAQAHAYGVTSMELLVRVAGGRPLDLAPALRDAVWQIDPELPIAEVREVPRVIAAHAAHERFAARLLGAFAGLALVLGMAGVYGVIAYAVARRTREIGIRMALGAPRAAVLRQVVGRGLRLIALGIAAGGVAAILLGRLLANLLYGVAPGDPGILLAVALLVAAAGVASCALPARKASTIDPAIALRHD